MTGDRALTLDRMAVEDGSSNPERLAAAIHDQLGLTTGPVPVEAIAAALDIVEIRTAETSGTRGRSCDHGRSAARGSILVRAGANRQRRRFTIAHELGHFLSTWHESSVGGSFVCSESDLGVGWQNSVGADTHRRQEAEANRFAIELLAPRRLISNAALRGTPDLEKVIDLSRDLDISREACARRWLELLDEPMALVFGKEGIVRYVERSPSLPFRDLPQD